MAGVDANYKFRFRIDRRTRWFTLGALAVIACGVGALFYSSGGSYLPAWFTTVVAALLLLAALSIPRFMRVSPHSVEIHCVMELIKIPVRDIRYVRFIERSQMRYCFPIWGIYGIGGYYGYYFSLRERKVFRLAASQWRNFVLIEDIYEEQYVVSCDDPATFVQAIEQYK
ncbi:MAG TPA: hypothetical protein H9888_08300 [Candidatus Rikenella faecigallinarum]|uniref:Bacterial Pleckstrin homology domain-containing protein n=1 Tax=Candidatus Rikenella faecigallinarum TaxID=2838745 RepID=A0A9D1QFY0_9BACT|nr:hypothetical protein [Candidatus Rikenella faecigallinarum]